MDPSGYERDERESKGSEDGVTGTAPGRANGGSEAYDSKKKKKKKKKTGGWTTADDGRRRERLRKKKMRRGRWESPVKSYIESRLAFVCSAIKGRHHRGSPILAALARCPKWTRVG